ncbi:serine/threonine-protein kinase [Polyangium aurulentum]|uniref:serine/threonine-protein kinase n=1 Tax=Polyangium aurulentum TaxID=2567896 RepID=UPI0010AE1247|nr:serine/threonine-protein kinase [Polyangium aurulentum]UQA62615.1 serine/threonine protein kinase [Polyangium aurulentum]
MAEVAVREEVSRSARYSNTPTRRCPKCSATYPLDFLVCPIDTTALEIHGVSGDDPLIGEVLAGSFCVVRVLGSGGMGRVYEAQHVRLPRRFAVKVMHEQLARQADAMARFEREAQAAARVMNEHVLDVVDVVRTKDRRPCIVSELLEGEELGDQLERMKKLPLGTAITICRQVCRGLAAAHAEGIVHRDLKPSNLFLVKRPDGGIHVKILDFGVAKLNDSDLTRSGVVIGTPAFMAPEQAKGSSNVDARADVYAVGAVLYRMLTGQAPFPNEDQARTLVRLLTEDPPRPRSLDKSIPEGVEALIQRAMARAPRDRPASVTELDQLLMTFDEEVHAEVARISRISVPMAAPGEASGGGLEVTRGMALGVTKRARYTRPAALGLGVLASVSLGAATLATTAIGFRALAGRTALGMNDLALAGAGAGVVTIFALIDFMRVLTARWRSVPSIERLRDGLVGTLRWLFVTLGVLALLWYGANALTPPLLPIPEPFVGPVQFGIVLAPTVLAFFALLIGVRRAGRVD